MIDTIDDSIVNLLRYTDLTEKQKKTYAAMLELGESSVSDIAKKAGLKRPITYVIIEELQQKGYTVQKPNSTKKKYSATDPNKLVSNAKEQLKNLEDMLPYLKSIQRRAGRPYIQYFEGKDAATKAFSQIHNPKGARYALSLPATKANIPKEFERWKKIYLSKKSNNKGKHFIKGNKNDGYITALNKGGQEIRFVPKDFPFSMDIALVEDTVYLTGFDEVVHITVINSKAIYDVFCSVYEVLWSSSKDKY